MPIPSRVAVKASIVYLALGAILGALLSINRWVPLGAWIAALRASHVQLLVVGWLTQLILGVAWWLFPLLPKGLRRDAPRSGRRGQQPRGSEPLFWATVVCLNTGVLLRAVFEPMYSWTRIDFFGFLTGISGLFLAVAALTFVVNMWGRIRGSGLHSLA